MFYQNSEKESLRTSCNVNINYYKSVLQVLINSKPRRLPKAQVSEIRGMKRNAQDMQCLLFRGRVGVLPGRSRD